ncbi:MAG TPA: quinone oxidoreductase [Blastocatellia bacterium]|nr:quinone oxidoreductase [Blastocatellia bacterium]
MHAIRVHQHGGPEVLSYEEIATPEPGAGEVLVKIKAIGVNYVDVYHREGRYPTKLPFTAGQEAAGTVEAVGEGVADLKPGDRVAYSSVIGSYAEYASVPAAKLVPVPAGVDDRSAAAALLQGMTAHYLSHTTYPIRAGDNVLIHAAAGGVGLLLTQMAHNLGARIIATVSTEEKARLAREAGADDVIIYTETDFETETRRLTGGRGVEAVYDAVGKTTFEKSLNSLKPLGYMVLYGAASGPVPPFDPLLLTAKGSLFLTRPSLAHYTPDHESLLARAADVLGQVESGKLRLRIEHTYELEDAAKAHRDLESRATTGKLLLLPS